MNRDCLPCVPPPSPLRVLLLEDRDVDAELIEHALRRSGFAPVTKRVETETEFLGALESTLDVVVADYSLPQWSGMAALDAVQASGFEIPVIIVSGVVGDESAAAVVRHGATDFLLKDRLARLGNSVRRALHETQLRRERLAALTSLRIANDQMAQLLEHNPAVLYIMSAYRPYALRVVGDSVSRLLGLAPAEIQAPNGWLDRLHASDQVLAQQGVSTALATGASRTEYRLRHADGHYCWIDDVCRSTRGANGQPDELVGVWIDITERKRAEAERERLLAELQAAQTTVRTLSGLLPICSSCKHIRDDRGTWHRIETYIRKHSQAEFTHGLCPDCVRTHFPSLGGTALNPAGGQRR